MYNNSLGKFNPKQGIYGYCGYLGLVHGPGLGHSTGLDIVPFPAGHMMYDSHLVVVPDTTVACVVVLGD